MKPSYEKYIKMEAFNPILLGSFPSHFAFQVRIPALLDDKFVIREGEPPEFIRLLSQGSVIEKTA